MSAPLVAVADSVFPNLDPARGVLSRLGADLAVAPEATPEAIVRVAAGADALLVTYATITAEMIRQLTRCRVISRFGIGVDNVDIAAATSAGIVVTKVPDYCLDEVSDHALALMLALVRKIPFSNARVHAGRWEMRSVVPIYRLRGSVLGLVGFGKIPRLVAPKAMSFGLRVVAFDPYVAPDDFTREGVERVELSQLVTMSDVVSIHSPLVPETRHLFSDDIFRQMKPTAYLINTARGPIVDEAALARALDAGRLAGAALDVMTPRAAAVGLLALRPRQCHHHAAYQLLLGGVAHRAADQGGRGSGCRARRGDAPQSRESRSAGAKRPDRPRDESDGAPGGRGSSLSMTWRRPALVDGDQVLVRVTHSGVCGTDLKIYGGAIPVAYPRVMGHEDGGRSRRGRWRRAPARRPGHRRSGAVLRRLLPLPHRADPPLPTRHAGGTRHRRRLCRIPDDVAAPGVSIAGVDSEPRGAD